MFQVSPVGFLELAGGCDAATLAIGAVPCRSTWQRGAQKSRSCSSSRARPSSPAATVDLMLTPRSSGTASIRRVSWGVRRPHAGRLVDARALSAVLAVALEDETDAAPRGPTARVGLRRTAVGPLYVAVMSTPMSSGPPSCTSPWRCSSGSPCRRDHAYLLATGEAHAARFLALAFGFRDIGWGVVYGQRGAGG